MTTTHHVMCTMWALVVSMVIGGVYGEFCPLESYDCSLIGSPCIIVRDPGCTLTDPGSADSHYPGPVTDLDVKSEYMTPEPTNPTVSRSKVSMSWIPPTDVNTRQYIKAFSVQIVADSAPYCFYYNISGATWDMRNREYKFWLNCTYLERNGYGIEVRSLPKAPYSDMSETAMLTIVGKKKDDPESPYDCSDQGSMDDRRLCWSTDISVYNRPCDRQVIVHFTLSPDVLQISHYMVSLNKKASLAEDDTHETVSHIGWHTFASVTLDVSDKEPPLLHREIKIIPQDSKCNGNNCRISLSMAFDILEVAADGPQCTFVSPMSTVVSTTTTEGPGLPLGAMIGIIVASIVAAFLIVLLIVMLSWRKRPQKPFQNVSTNSERHLVAPVPSVKHSMNITTPKHLTKVKVLFLYSNDNHDHKNVIGNFARFLTIHGSCVVVLDEWSQSEMRQSRLAWIEKTMTQVDYILLINSKGTYYKSHACLNGKRYSEAHDDSCMGDMFSPAFEFLESNISSLANKVILAHFDYTPRQFRSLPFPQLSGEKVNYMLMNDIERLYFHIHNINSDNGPGSMTAAKFNDDNYYELQEGEQLHRAIVNANNTLEVHKPPTRNPEPEPARNNNNIQHGWSNPLYNQKHQQPDDNRTHWDKPHWIPPDDPTPEPSTRQSIHFGHRFNRPIDPDEVDTICSCDIDDINRNDSGYDSYKNKHCMPVMPVNMMKGNVSEI